MFTKIKTSFCWLFRSYKAFTECFLLCIYTTLFYTLPSVFWIFSICALINGHLVVKVLLILYMAYIIIDCTINSSLVNGNGWMSLRNGGLFRHITDYFPIEMRKTAELPPDRHYILAHFPHGLLAAAVSVPLTSDISNWLQLFPGIRPKLATLNMNLCTPFLREFWRLIGYVPSSKKALSYYLTRPTNPAHPHNKDGFTSYVLGLVVGGAREAKDSKPGQYIITLKKRKGFVKLAIQTGAYIVPSFGFGEVDICSALESKWFPPIQAFFYKTFGFHFTILKGRINGLLPHRGRLGFVIGSPIAVQRDENPDPKYIDEIHQQVVVAVQNLFETYKADYLENSAQIKLIIN